MGYFTSIFMEWACIETYATQDNFVSLEEELGCVQLNYLPCLCHVDVTCIILSLELGIGCFLVLVCSSMQVGF